VTHIPLHTARLVDRLLARYCARICPPRARHPVQLGYRIEADRVTVCEIRPFCGVPGTHSLLAIAQFRFNAAHGDWRIHALDEAGHWRAVGGGPNRSFLALLRELDADEAGHFWGRVDGKSLRWCSSQGRCADCNERYCAILGLTAT